MSEILGLVNEGIMGHENKPFLMYTHVTMVKTSAHVTERLPSSGPILTPGATVAEG